jgi:16S rRNA processing protein RimM
MTLKTTDCIRIGTISKTHGVSGRMIVKTEYNLELANFEEPVFAVIDGLPVPLFLEEIEEKNGTSYIVKFELINNPDKAKEFIGCELLGSRIISGQEKINFMSQLRGFEIYDVNYGKIGICKSIEPIPGNPLMIVETETESIHIPIVDEWITEFVPNKRLTVKCPQGLLC